MIKKETEHFDVYLKLSGYKIPLAKQLHYLTKHQTFTD